jgi:deazaflavin-dependent oxidoreductase (nitroreductase family)
MKVRMQKHSGDLLLQLASLKGEEYCYLTTTGRVTGKPHEIEIWFGLKEPTLYLLSGGMDKSDWVKNLMKQPTVTVRIARHTFLGTARLVKDEKEETMARYLLAEKYQEWETGRTLSEWARTALVVAIDIKQGE